MALSDILKKIIADAEREAAEIAKKNADRIKTVHKQADEKVAVLEKEFAEETKKRKESMDRKVEAHAQMELKMGEVDLKSAILEKVKTSAVEAIYKLPESDLLKILEKLLSDINEEGKIHPAKNHEKIVQKAVEKSGKKFEMGDPIDIMGGFLFEGAKIDIDANFETLLQREVYDKVETEISEILFSE